MSSELQARAAQRIVIRNKGLSAKLSPLGATLCDLRLAGVAHPLVLGWANPDDYLCNDDYLGPIVGRCANRIARASYSLSGQQFSLDRNFRDRHCLHGGRDGAAVQMWQVTRQSETCVTFALVLPDGHMGFGGKLSVEARFRVEAPATLVLEIEARSEGDTICNFAPHSYFNLNGTGDITDHVLQVFANQYLPVDDDLIPQGSPAPVEGTDFDFREPKAIGKFPYDHNFCVSHGRTAEKPVAKLHSRNSGVRLELSSTEPGLQVYSGMHLNQPGKATLSGEGYTAFAGLALEPQCWPDAPNNPDFPGAVLRDGQLYRHVSQFAFSRDGASGD